jgi:hypothetical protein
MEDVTALKIACKLLKDTAQLHVDESLHYKAYIEAYNTLTAMQMGLDGECDEKALGWRESILAKDWDTPEEDEAWKCLDEKALGWRESEHR